MTGQSGDAPRRLRRRPSRLKGRSAIAARRPPAALDPGASAAPAGKTRAGQGPAPRGARRSLQITGSHQSESPRFQGIPRRAGSPWRRPRRQATSSERSARAAVDSFDSEYANPVVVKFQIDPELAAILRNRQFDGTLSINTRLH